MCTKVVEVDINCLERINNIAGYDALEIFFRAGRDPIGRIRIPCNSGSVETDELQVLINHLTLPSPPDFPNEDLPSVTVAICTRNRPESLTDTLQSLSRQKHPIDEIIVVDNGGQEEVRVLTQDILPNAIYVIERRPGLDFARNRALSTAKGDVIAFLDDDVQADPFWVLSIAESFAAFHTAGAVTGLILPLELETSAQELFEANGGFERGFFRRVLPGDSQKKFGIKFPFIAESIGIGSGCNMAFKTSVLKDIGGFDEALDTGPPLPGGGDLDIFYRVVRAGYNLVYEPRAMVRHQHRRTTLELRSQLTGHYRSLSAFLVKTLGAERGWAWFGVALFLIWRLLKPGFRLIRGLIWHDVFPLSFLFRIFYASLAGLGSYRATSSQFRDQIRECGGQPARLKGQLSELWRYRELLWDLTVRDLKVKYKGSFLGFLWTLFNPLVTVIVLTVVFSIVVRINITNYWAFLISGYFAWNFFAQTLTGGIQSALSSAHLTRSAYFPQEVLVISSAIARLLEFLGELVLVLLILAVFHHKGLPLSFIMVLPLVPILFLLAIGFAFPLVTLAIYYEDTIQIIPLLIMMWFYLSPVFYNLDIVPESLRAFYSYNPMALLLSMYHDAFYIGKMPDLSVFLTLVGLDAVLLLLSYSLFNSKKREFSEII